MGPAFLFAGRGYVGGVPGEKQAIPARGASANPANRFEKLEFERDAEWNPEDDPVPAMRFYRDSTARKQELSMRQADKVRGLFP